MCSMAETALYETLRPALVDWPTALRLAVATVRPSAAGIAGAEALADEVPEPGEAASPEDSAAVLARALVPLGVRVRAVAGFAEGMSVAGAAMLGRIGDAWCVLRIPTAGGALALDADGEPAGVPLADVLRLAKEGAVLLAPAEAGGAASTPAYMATLRGWWHRYAEIILAGVGINLLALVLPAFSMLVYDKIVGNGITETLWALALGVVLAAVLDFLLRATRAWYVEQIAHGSDRELDRSILERLMASRNANLPPVGPVLNKYKELAGAREFITSNYVLNAADLPFLAFFLIALWLIAGPLVIVLLVFAGGMVFVHAVLSVPARDYASLSRQAVARKMALLVEVLAAGELLKTSRLRAPTARRWRALADSAALAAARGRFWSSVSVASTNFWIVGCTAAILVAGVYRIEAQELTTGGLVACSMLASRAMAASASVALLFTRYRDFRRASAELDEMIAAPAAEESAAALAPRRIEGRLAAHDLSYRFSADGASVLRDVNLRIEPGERVALLGRPGSGKTTLLRCLAGVVAPSQGAVLLDGANVRAHHPAARALWVSYKPQEPHVFEGSLEDNVRAGADEASAENLRAAIDVAGLGEAIAAGELSLDMQLETRGANLSGGQRQAVALARALVGDPSLLLLDEPTAGLDQLGEKAVANRLREYSRGRTLIVATHSPAVVAIVDRLIVVDRGRIVADGPKERILLGREQAV